ncbi:glucose-1-phosphate cytidylyltransferase [Candidatus Woesearchaeota archaeon]|nr:glucose-1-phosphate cytidylyltransferase [Candidatus Woesearchaeota archaeon]
MEKPKVVILCGGEGTRLKEVTELIPKPMVRIGHMPILWQIMKIYSHYGFNDFVLCLGYKGEVIKNFFLNYEHSSNDFTLNLRSHQVFHHSRSTEDWNITFANTGPRTETGGRIKRIEKYIDGDNFLMTYGDGVSNVNIPELIAHHKSKGKLATLTALNPRSKFGTVEVDDNDIVNYFREKPLLKDWVSGGFFVFDKGIFDYLWPGEDCCLERKPFEDLARDKQFTIYKHQGFWHCMDTFKDMKVLDNLWNQGQAPWKIWNE